MSTSIRWDRTPGTFDQHSPITKRNNAKKDIGKTVQVDAIMSANETVIPSYTCTLAFDFSPTPSTDYKYAYNSLSHTCSSARVLTWCKYYNCIRY